MLFNSIDFALFLPIVFIIYWCLNFFNLRKQNLFLVFASYLFYGWWDWRFLALIFFSSVVDFVVGISINKSKVIIHRKIFLWISICANIGVLGFFKYYNFFLDSFKEAFAFFGEELNSNSLDIILPVGISFYTFQTLSYTIDIYKNKLTATKDFISFVAFVSFFPQLVAGPIERASNLLPQFFRKRSFNYNSAVDGMRQILWGFFKKIVIADNCAQYVDLAFSSTENLNGSSLLIGILLFSFQIYADFSGYSDIAIGVSRLFGFKLMQNFAYPYFSRDIAEFWRRWHISLSSWFRDYIYIPLGGSKVNNWVIIRNVLIVFIVSGFWHGANWTFVIWGFINAIYFLPLILTQNNRSNIDIVAQSKTLPSLSEILQIGFTFLLISISWIFFRAESVLEAWVYLRGIFSLSFFNYPELFPHFLFLLIIVFIVIEWLGRNNDYALQKLFDAKPRIIRWGFYLVVTLSIVIGFDNEQDFIYFQF